MLLGERSLTHEIKRSQHRQDALSGADLYDSYSQELRGLMSAFSLSTYLHMT